MLKQGKSSQHVILLSSFPLGTGGQIHGQSLMRKQTPGLCYSSSTSSCRSYVVSDSLKLNLRMFSCRVSGSDRDETNNVPANPLLPKITMVGISMGEAGPGQASRANLKKTMEDLTKELEQSSQKSLKSNEETDPLFVANVGDYSSITRMTST